MDQTANPQMAASQANRSLRRQVDAESEADTALCSLSHAMSNNPNAVEKGRAKHTNHIHLRHDSGLAWMGSDSQQ
jgi:hypothetical protein